MDSADEDSPIKLKAEIKRLQLELRHLSKEKNLMEYKLFRAFHKLLNTKKRMIQRLEGRVRELGGNLDFEEDRSHCDTCTCRTSSKPILRLQPPREHTPVRGNEKNLRREEDDSETTFDSNDGGYSDETDVDDEPASSSRKRDPGNDSKKVGGTVSKEQDNPGVSDGGNDQYQVSSSTDVDMPEAVQSSEEEESLPLRRRKQPRRNSKTQRQVQNNPENSPSDDVDELVDELCG